METVEKHKNELCAVLNICRALGESFDLEKNLTHVMNMLSRHFETERGCIILAEKKEKMGSELSFHEYGSGFRLPIERISDIGKRAAGQVLDTGTIHIVLKNGDVVEVYNENTEIPEKKDVYAVTAPIKHNGDGLGIFCVDRIYKNGSLKDDIRVVNNLISNFGPYISLNKGYKKKEMECRNLKSRLNIHFLSGKIIGDSPGIRKIVKCIHHLALSKEPVLIIGESGTGKELIANTIHEQYQKCAGRFVPVHLSVFPRNLMESELFGIEKGSFNGNITKRVGKIEQANGGTLFIDEFMEMSKPIQQKFCGFLEKKRFQRVGSTDDGYVNARVIAATSGNILDALKQKSLNEELYWLISQASIVIPPLRERKGDIPLLVQYYLDKFNKMYDKQISFAENAMDAFVNYGWPGNVRELVNTTERLVITDNGSVTRKLTADDLPVNIVSGDSIIMEENKSVISHVFKKFPSPAIAGKNTNLNNEVAMLERKRIVNALKEHNYIQQKASRALGITPRQLGYRIKKYNIVMQRAS